MNLENFEIGDIYHWERDVEGKYRIKRNLIDGYVVKEPLSFF